MRRRHGRERWAASGLAALRRLRRLPHWLRRWHRTAEAVHAEAVVMCPAVLSALA